MIRNSDDFKKRLDTELGYFVFERKSQVIETISGRRGKVKRWLEKEITVPVGVFACILLVFATLLISQCFSIIHMDDNEVESSRILVKNLTGGDFYETPQN